jgi:quercetin dioxygenase-like cupin family protein
MSRARLATLAGTSVLIGRVQRVAAGQTATVHAGEWVIERPQAVHFGGNRGSTSVVILLATLFKNGSPPSIPVAQ